jgi:2-iminobutanoate/2-iminopropanoate deaminase
LKNIARPIGPYSQVVRAGELLLFSGQLGIDPEKGELVSDDLVAQFKSILKNMSKALAELNLTMSNCSENKYFPNKS